MNEFVSNNPVVVGFILGMIVFAFISEFVMETMRYIDYLYDRRKKREKEKNNHGG